MYFISQLVGITTFLLFAASQTVAADFSQGLHPNYKQGELIVRFKDQTLAATSLSARKSSILRSYKRLPLHHIKLPDDITVSEALTAYRNDPNVLYAEPNYRVRKLALPNDLRFRTAMEPADDRGSCRLGYFCRQPGNRLGYCGDSGYRYGLHPP